MPAKIRSGTKIYVKSTSTISLGTPAGTQAGGEGAGLQQIDTGIELTVTPQITVDNTIKLRIDASQSEADFSRTVDGIPAVVDSTASTTVLLEDGSTTVIGGLYRVRSSKQKRGVPGFQRLPLVGNLFKHQAKTKTDTELMIFITPTIVRF
jgi:type IV pilus assembly protein PilQ